MNQKNTKKPRQNDEVWNYIIEELGENINLLIYHRSYLFYAAYHRASLQGFVFQLALYISFRNLQEFLYACAPTVPVLQIF